MKCRICHCNDERSCPAGCEWARGEGNICSVCNAFKGELRDYVEMAKRVTGSSLARLLEEIKAANPFRPENKDGG